MTAREHEAAVPLGTGAMFDRIAGRYDFLNRVISLGLDLRWRRLAIDALEVGTSSKVLDLATGTADLAIEVAKRGAEVHVVGLDPSPKMLEVGRVKLAERALDRRVELVLGDAAALPFEDASFDRVSMAFGIRNMPDRPKVLAEIARVLRPGGRLAILELSTPERGLLASAARIHIHQIVPRIGAFLSGEQEYRHLERSIAKFPRPEEFAAMIDAAGMESHAPRLLTFGVCVLYVADKPAAKGRAA